MTRLLLEENPRFWGARRRRKAHRNPLNPLAGTRTLKKWTQGVGVTDAVAAVGGLYAASMLPGAIVPAADTVAKKILKLSLGIASAIGAGAVGSAMVGSRAGQAAIIGGLAGTTVQALALFTDIRIGESSPKMLARRPIGAGERQLPSQAPEEVYMSVT